MSDSLSTNFSLDLGCNSKESDGDFNLYTEADTATKSLKMINMVFHCQLNAISHSAMVCEITNWH